MTATATATAVAGLPAARAVVGSIEGCSTCARLSGSVVRTDALAHRGAFRALTAGETTSFARATRAHEDAVRRLQTHLQLDHPATDGRAAG